MVSESRFGRSIASSGTDGSNPQGGKKGKDKNKDLAVLMDKRFADINNSRATLTDRVDDMEKPLKELESMGDFEEHRGEVQVAMNVMLVDVNKEVQALRHLKPPKRRNSKLARPRWKPTK